jgi:hypothetical protein
MSEEAAPEAPPPPPPDPEMLAALETLAARLRSVSKGAGVLRLEDVWGGTEEALLEAVRTQGVAGLEDMALLHDGGRTYVYSSRRMTPQYALMSARADADDLRHAIAETVRSDSVVYPRPTAVEFFCGAPYFFAPDAVDEAIGRLLGDPQYQDIQEISASNGARFLYSSAHMVAPLAQSLAEWAAVDRFNNF